MGYLVKARPYGPVVRVVSDKSLVFVKTIGTFEDNDDITYDEEIIVAAKIIYRGSKGVREYFCYEEGDIVMIGELREMGGSEKEMFEPDCYDFHNFYYERLFGALGSFYNEGLNEQPAFYEKVRLIDFGIGSITVDLEDKTLDIEFEGEITINGKEIYLNG